MSFRLLLQVFCLALYICHISFLFGYKAWPCQPQGTKTEPASTDVCGKSVTLFPIVVPS